MLRVPQSLQIRIGLLIAIICLFSAVSAQAASWNVDANGNWSLTTNWASGSVPNAPAAIADFSTIDITADRTITLDGTAVTYTVGSITFNDTNTATAGSWTIARASTNTLTLDNTGGIGDPTITVNALGTGKTATISAPIVGTSGGGLTKAGVGTLTLSGANSYTGNTTISNGTLTLSGANTIAGTTTLSAGTLNINNATALGSSIFTINGGTIDNTAAAAITLTNGNVQNWNSDFTFTGTRDLNLGTGAVTFSANRQVTVNAGNLTVGGNIAGASYSLTKTGNGNLILAGSANVYTGGTTISSGALVAANTGALPNWNNGAPSGGVVTVSAGATLGVNIASWQTTDIDTLRASTSVAWAAGSYLGIDTSSSDNSFGNMADKNITTPIGLNKLGANTLTLNGTNTYTGGTKVSAGLLLVNTTTLLPNWNGLGTGAISVSTGATLEVPVGGTSDWSAANINTLRGNVTWALGSYLGIDTTNTSPSYTISDNITTPNMGINKMGSNTLILSGNNTYTGGNIVAANGTVQMGSATALGASTGTLAVNGTLDIASYSPTVGALSGASTGIITTTTVGTNTLTVDTTGTTTYSGIILNGSGTSMALVKRGTGTLTLSTTAITLATGSTYTGGTTIAGGTLTINDNALHNIGTNLGTGTITFQNGGILNLAGLSDNAIAYPNAYFIDAGQSGTINMSRRYNMNGAVTGAGSLTLNIAMSAARDYLNNNWAGFSGTLYLTGNGRNDFAINGGGSAYNALGMANTTLYIDGTSAAAYVTASTMTNSGNGNEIAIGALASNTTFGHLGSGMNNGGGFTGLARYTIGAKNLETVFSGTVDANTMITKTGTGKLTLAGPVLSTGNTNYAAIVISSGTLQIGNGGSTGSLAPSYATGYGRVTNNDSLIFNLSNTTTLPIVNAISGTGTTTINGGTIYFNSTVANPVTVNSGGIVGGQGTISLPVTVAAGGGIEGGQAGLGLLSVNSLQFLGAGTANFLPTYGSTSQLLNVTNGVTTNNLGTGSVVINILGLPGMPLGNGTYDLIKYGTTITNFNDFSLGSNPGAGPRGPKTYVLQNDTADKQINLVVGGAVGEITWTGAVAGQSWDQIVRLPGTTNWKYTTGGAATDFYTGDNITFDDNGAKTVNINTTDVAPGSMTFNNSVGNDYTIQGSRGIGNGTGILKNGAGKVTISNINSFTGATTINAGTISIASDATTGSAPLGLVPTAVNPKSIVLNGGALSASATMTLSPNRGIVLGPVSGTGTGIIDVVNSGQTLTYAGVIANNYDNNGSSNSSFTKTGLGTLLLTGANVHTGETVIAGGTLTVGNVNALQYSTLNYNNQGGTLTFTGTAATSATFGGLTGAQDLGLSNDSGNAVALTIGNNNAGNTYTGNLSGTGALYKTGTGTQTITGTSTYIGNTYVGGLNSTSWAGSPGSIIYSGSASLNNSATLVIGYRGYDFASVIFRDDATANLQYITFGNNLASGGGSLTIEGNANVNVGNTVNLSYTLGGGTVTNNTLNLNGGTLTVAAFTKTQVTDTRHQSTINFNGTLLMGTYGGVMLPAFANLTANVQAGGVRIDDVGNTVEIDQPLIHDAALGATADGGLHKIGIGTLILGGNNTYTGTTTIDGGTLQLGNGSVGVGGLLGTGAVANSGAIVLNRTDTFTMPNAIADGIGGPGSLEQKGYGSKAILTSPNTYTGATTVTGGTLLLSGSQATSGVTVNSINGPAGFGAGTGGTTIQALTLGTSPSDTQTLVPSDGTNLTTINVASLVNNGATTITPGNLGVQAYTLGLHVLVDYDTISGAGSFGLSLPARVTGYLQTIGTAIDLNVTAVKYPKWNGNLNNGSGAGDWDIGYLNINGTPASGTQNWKEYTTGTSTVYQEGPPADFVYFDDSATGVTTVNLTTTVMPALVTVDNSTKNYTFIGPGSISGATALIKSGTGALVIANDVDNTYTGGTTINAGTIQLGNGGTTGFVPGNIVNNGALAFDRTDTALTISSVISGAGTVSQIGSGTTTLSGTNTFTGDTVISNGVLMLGTATTLQTSTLDSQGGRLSFGTTLTVATLGGLKGSQGIALTNDNATPANVALTVGNNNADTSYAGALTGGGSLTKIGTGTLTLTGSNVFSGATTITLGNIVVSGSGGLNTNAAITVGRTDYTGNAASLTFQNSATGTFASLNFGGTLRSGGNFTIQDSANVVMSGSFDLNNENPGSTVNSNNIVALNGGTLAVNAFILTAVRVNHLATMNFNGATLKPNGAITTGTYLPALSGLTANVQTGGAKFDDLGGVVQIDQPLIHDAALGTTLDGGLTKIGTGTLILTGANTYTGPTTVNNGLLQLATTGQIAADISTAATSATFQVLGGTHTVGNISGIGNTNLLTGGSLTASSIVQGTVTLGIGARLTIAPIPGGPTAGAGSLTAVPEPSTWAMLMLAAMGLGIYRRRSR